MKTPKTSNTPSVKEKRALKRAEQEARRLQFMVTVAEAAARMGLRPATVYERVKNGGDLPPFYRFGAGRRCVLRFRCSDIEQWLERHRVEPAA